MGVSYCQNVISQRPIAALNCSRAEVTCSHGRHSQDKGDTKRGNSKQTVSVSSLKSAACCRFCLCSLQMVRHTAHNGNTFLVRVSRKPARDALPPYLHTLSFNFAALSRLDATNVQTCLCLHTGCQLDASHHSFDRGMLYGGFVAHAAV